METPLTIPIGEGQVSGLLLRPDGAKVLFVFAHGAGVGMNHSSMASNAQGLAERGIATLRFQFPYMEKRSGRPDPPRIAHAAVRAAVGAAGEMAGDLPLFAGTPRPVLVNGDEQAARQVERTLGRRPEVRTWR